MDDSHDGLAGAAEKGPAPLYQSHVFLNQSKVLDLKALQGLFGDLHLCCCFVADAHEVVLIDVRDVCDWTSMPKGCFIVPGRWVELWWLRLSFVLFAHEEFSCLCKHLFVIIRQSVDAEVSANIIRSDHSAEAAAAGRYDLRREVGFPLGLLDGVADCLLLKTQLYGKRLIG